MKEALERALYSKYPFIFDPVHLPTSKKPMVRNIECGDGWYPLLDGLCEVLSSRALNGDQAAVEAMQVKQKFGGLRFFFDGGCDHAEGAASMASAMSYHVCEETGRPGTLMARNRWVRTLAEDVGRMRGYRSLGLSALESVEWDMATEVVNLPLGWHAIAAVLKGVIAKAAPSAVVRFGHRSAGLSVDIRNGTEWAKGAGECALALSVRTDAVTGTMLIPI